MRQTLHLGIAAGLMVTMCLTHGSAQSPAPTPTPTFSRDVAPDSLRQLRHLPSRRRKRADVAHQLPGGASLGAAPSATRSPTAAMPPWHADAPPGTFENERRLTAAQKRRHRPVGGGRCARGRPRGPPAARRRFDDGWRIGTAGRRLRDARRLRGARARHDRVRVLLHPDELHRDASGCRRSKCGPATARSCTTCSSTTRRRRTARRARPVLAPNPRAQPRCRAREHRLRRRATPGRPSRAASRPMRLAPIRRSSATARPCACAPGGVLQFQMHYTTNGTAGTDRTKVGMVLRQGSRRPGDPRDRPFLNAHADDSCRRRRPSRGHRRRVPAGRDASGASSRTRTCAASGGATRWRCPTAPSRPSCRCRATTSTGRPTTCSRSRCGAQGQPHRLDRLVRQLGGEPVQPRSHDHREVGRSDVGGDAVFRSPVQRRLGGGHDGRRTSSPTRRARGSRATRPVAS